jgi:hypothetical protein
MFHVLLDFTVSISPLASARLSTATLAALTFGLLLGSMLILAAGLSLPTTSG